MIVRQNIIFESGFQKTNPAITQVQASWDNHAAAFGASDVDKILLDYTEDSVIIVTDFTTNVNAVFTGLDGVRDCFTALFAYLAATEGAFPSSLEVPELTVEAGQVFLIWRAVAAGVVHATDTFITDENGKFITQTVTVWTAADKPLLTGESVDLNAAVPGTAAQAHWDNHLDAFATGDIEKMVLDYREDAQIIEWDFATDTKIVSTGIAGVRDLFPKYFGWAGECGDNLDVGLPTIRVTESYIYLHVTFPCAGIPLWTDTFILDSDGMIVRQNIVFESGFPKTPDSSVIFDRKLAATQASWDNHAAAFVASDVEKILLDYTEDSVITVTDFTTNVNAVFTGLDGVRG